MGLCMPVSSALGLGGTGSSCHLPQNPSKSGAGVEGGRILRQRVTLSRGGGFRQGKQLQLNHKVRSSPGWDGAHDRPGICREGEDEEAGSGASGCTSCATDPGHFPALGLHQAPGRSCPLGPDQFPTSLSLAEPCPTSPSALPAGIACFGVCFHWLRRNMVSPTL